MRTCKGAAGFHRQLVKGDLASEYETEIQRLDGGVQRGGNRVGLMSLYGTLEVTSTAIRLLVAGPIVTTIRNIIGIKQL